VPFVTSPNDVQPLRRPLAGGFLSVAGVDPRLVGRGRRTDEATVMRPIGLVSDRTCDEIPASHRDLVECPPVAALTTIMADGSPQTSVVWCDFDGAFVRVNTMRGFAKERNMRRDPRVTLLCYDPRQPLRYLEVRGTVVEMTEDGAARHLDELASKYAGRPIRYFGDAIPARFADTEVPVLCRIRPTRVVALDATSARDER
jgi:PPOX class probable F420-dependent enzyme